MIRLFLERQDGRSPEPVDDYDPADFGEQVPAVGDLIIDPGVPQGRDRSLPESRTIYEVTARYFEPRTTGDGDIHIALVVKARQGGREEVNIL